MTSLHEILKAVRGMAQTSALIPNPSFSYHAQLKYSSSTENPHLAKHHTLLTRQPNST